MCTYGLRVPASRVGYVPEAQGGLSPGPHVQYVLGTRASLGRSVPTMSRGYHPRWSTTTPSPSMGSDLDEISQRSRSDLAAISSRSRSDLACSGRPLRSTQWPFSHPSISPFTPSPVFHGGRPRDPWMAPAYINRRLPLAPYRHGNVVLLVLWTVCGEWSESARRPDRVMSHERERSSGTGKC